MRFKIIISKMDNNDYEEADKVLTEIEEIVGTNIQDSRKETAIWI